MILAPLRGVTIRSFRTVFADELAEAGFTEAVTPFVSAMTGVDPLKDRELKGGPAETALKVTPQFIGKDPAAFAYCLERILEAGYDTADLNCGCPFPMVRNKGRGSGLLRSPEMLARMLETGCRMMGPGKFSVKTRLGVERPDELLSLMPVFNSFPLRFLAVHGRTAKQMYDGECDRKAVAAVRAAAKVPVVLNGDIAPGDAAAVLAGPPPALDVMIGRPFVRALGVREDSGELLGRYLEASAAELCGDRPVLGRLKELVAYWKELPGWRRRWPVLKLCRTLDEFRLAIR